MGAPAGKRGYYGLPEGSGDSEGWWGSVGLRNLTQMWLRSFRLMSSIRLAERVWPLVQPRGCRTGIKSRLKGSRLAWAMPQRPTRR